MRCARADWFCGAWPFQSRTGGGGCAWRRGKAIPKPSGRVKPEAKPGRARLLRLHVPHAGRQGEAMVAGEFLRDPAQLQPVVRHLEGLVFIDVDPRPDNMVVFAAVVVDVKDDSARLPGKPQLSSGALD